MSIQTLMQNKEVLAKFKVGANVIIHEKAATHVKVYGHVVGFSLNPEPLRAGELMVRISVATRTGEQIQNFDPQYPDFSFEIV